MLLKNTMCKCHVVVAAVVAAAVEYVSNSILAMPLRCDDCCCVCSFLPAVGFTTYLPVLCFALIQFSMDDESVNCFFDQNSLVDFIIPFLSLDRVMHSCK